MFYSCYPFIIVTVLCILFAFLPRNGKGERLDLIWLWWSGFIHLAMDANYSFNTALVNRKSDLTFMEWAMTPISASSIFSPRWWVEGPYIQYAKYDGRFLTADPALISQMHLEVILGILCLLLILFIVRKHRLRHPLQIAVCSAHIYSTVLYFMPPLVDGTWSEIMTPDPMELWIYVVGLNAIWIGVPALMMIRSFRSWPDTR